jgi:diadenosine tetraphosphatase ApaH/serine/threonine PP2A family protein phosphatase
MRERAAAVVAGNHDYGVVGLTDIRFFNPYARAAAEWTRVELGAGDRAWLAGLPLTSVVSEATLVHASPRTPEEWDYLAWQEDGRGVFEHFSTSLCFVGHSHFPAVWIHDGAGVGYARGDSRIALRPAHRYLVNVGSVGQPRDRDPRAAYALWDETGGWVEWIRVAYPIPVTQRKMARAGLPPFLAERLARGV